MNIRKIRGEIAALREELTTPAGVEEPSARALLFARVSRTRERMLRSGVVLSEEEQADGNRRLAARWKEMFGREFPQ